MITEKHLAIVRAALTFWDEEMSMENESVYEHYLHSNDQGRKLTANDVADIRDYLNNVDLKVALLEKSSGTFDSDSPFELTNELSFQADRQTPVAVLVPISR